MQILNLVTKLQTFFQINQQSKLQFRVKKRVFSNSMSREILGERPANKVSPFLKANLNKDGLKTLLIDLDETLVSFTSVSFFRFTPHFSKLWNLISYSRYALVQIYPL